MKVNVGNIDRILRGVAGVALLAFGFLGGQEAMISYICMGVGAVFVLTSAFKFCPLYPLLGISTCKIK
ncbi:MAG: DUF2892 domain-containing protein [Mariprofundaceae bacterium]|nr:DUF2892 domain-containing protein [Mariprofundaceae bacterium]